MHGGKWETIAPHRHRYRCEKTVAMAQCGSHQTIPIFMIDAKIKMANKWKFFQCLVFVFIAWRAVYRPDGWCLCTRTHTLSTMALMFYAFITVDCFAGGNLNWRHCRCASNIHYDCSAHHLCHCHNNTNAKMLKWKLNCTRINILLFHRAQPFQFTLERHSSDWLFESESEYILATLTWMIIDWYRNHCANV